MRVVAMSQLSRNLGLYLGAVEDGESLLVTRHGKRIARIVPGPVSVERRRDDPAYKALCEILDRPHRLGGGRPVKR